MTDVAESPEREGEIFKCTGSMVIGMLMEGTKAAEKVISDLTRTKEELLVEVDKLRNRVTLLNNVNGKLFDKIAAQNKREIFFLEDREKLLHEIEVRKKTKTLLIQERKKFLQKLSGSKENAGYKELALNTASSRKKMKAALLQSRNRLLKFIEARKSTEKVLLEERAEFIKCFSKRIRAQKRESQERKRCEVKLHKALDKLQHYRDTVSDKTITVLWDVTKKVLALTKDVEDSQSIGDKTSTPRSKSFMKMLCTLPSNWKQAKKIISCAEDAFCKAAKNWVKDRDCIEAMKISCRKGLIEKILGRKERPSEAQAALRDILDESQTMERQPQMEHNSQANVELQDSEKKKVRRKQNNPQRLASPSPSPQETEVCRKRKRIGNSPPPSSEETKVPSERKKPQRHGTRLPPPSERMRVPRERKRPHRYRTIL